MNKDIEAFLRLLEKNFANQVIDEFLLVNIEKDYPPSTKPLLEDPRLLLECCFSIWDISSRLLIQEKKTLSSNAKYILRLRLLCCRLIYFIFQSELNVQSHEVPAVLSDPDIAQETFKMLVRCAQNCFEVEDAQKLDECLGLLKSIEEEFSISEIILKQNLQLYFLMNRWVLQYYANEDQEIPKSLIKKRFPQILSLMNENPSSGEKEQIITVILIIVCKIMTSDGSGKELAGFCLKILQDYPHLLVKQDLIQLFQKMMIYSSIQSQPAALQDYEKLTNCSEDRLTEYLKLLLEIKLKTSENISKEDLDLFSKKIEFLITHHEIDPEEFCAFVDEIVVICPAKNYRGLFLAQFIDINTEITSRSLKAKKVDLVAMRLIKYWIEQLETETPSTEDLQDHLHVVLKSILKDKVSSKKLPILEKNMIQLAKLLTVKKLYKLSFEFLESLVELIRKDHAQMLKEACILQVENCYYLKHNAVKRAFEIYDSIEPEKEEFLYCVCKLKTLITIAMTNDQEAQQLAHDIPLFLSSIMDSKNFNEKVFFLLLIELLQNTMNLQGNRLQNQTIMLKEFFIILKKGLEKVILNHEQELLESQEKKPLTLFQLFCVYLSHFEELFTKYKEEGTQFSGSLIHESIGSALEIGFLVLETFRIFCEKFILKYNSQKSILKSTWLVQQNELLYIDNFFWNLAIFVGYLNLDLNFALRFIFLSLKIKLMAIILNNLDIFGAFLDNTNDMNVEIELFLEFCHEKRTSLLIEENMLLSLVKTLLLFVSNTLCLLKRKENPILKTENLFDSNIVLKCLELNRGLIANSDLDNKVHSYLQYHCLVEFEYRILVCPETTRIFLDVIFHRIHMNPNNVL